MRRMCLALALLALALPAAAAARKNAWQLSSLSGTYQFHATNPNPAACSAGSAVLVGALLPNGDASPVAQSTTNSRFASKLLIPDGCADTKSQRLFVCK